jgi:hypothetical protein
MLVKRKQVKRLRCNQAGKKDVVIKTIAKAGEVGETKVIKSHAVTDQATLQAMADKSTVISPMMVMRESLQRFCSLIVSLVTRQVLRMRNTMRGAAITLLRVWKLFTQHQV